MEQFHYLIPFVGLIYGLSAAALLTHLHQLIEHRSTIDFHVVPLIWTFICFLIIINGWWAFFDINERVQLQNAGDLLLLSILPMLTFLLCATVLPNNLKHDKLPLWQHFLANRKAFFLLCILYLASIQLVSAIQIQGTFSLKAAISNGIGIVIFIILMVFKNVWVHLLLACLFGISLISTLSSQNILN